MPHTAADRVVIMVEDHPEVLALGGEMLEDDGWRVDGYETAEAALEALKGGAPCDLLFTDIILPGGLDGLQLVREVRALRPALPVLLTTGWADRLRETISSDYPLIGKPYRQPDLLRKVEEVTGSATGASVA